MFEYRIHFVFLSFDKRYNTHYKYNKIWYTMSNVDHVGEKYIWGLEKQDVNLIVLYNMYYEKKLTKKKENKNVLK